MRAPTYRLTLAYDGTRFAGYARQPGLTTVEGLLRASLDPFEPRALAVGGRTDRGVSAEAQVVSVRLHRAPSNAEVERALDGLTERGLRCTEVRTVARSFHASFSARARRYAYLHPEEPDLDVDLLNALISALVGRRCFSAFARDTPPGRSTVRTLREASVERRHHARAPVLAFHFVADAFLRRQVRVMVATALREARQGAPSDRMVRLAASMDRTTTAWPAPPEPLRLVRVLY